MCGTIRTTSGEELKTAAGMELVARAFRQDSIFTAGLSDHYFARAERWIDGDMQHLMLGMVSFTDISEVNERGHWFKVPKGFEVAGIVHFEMRDRRAQNLHKRAGEGEELNDEDRQYLDNATRFVSILTAGQDYLNTHTEMSEETKTLMRAILKVHNRSILLLPAVSPTEPMGTIEGGSRQGEIDFPPTEEAPADASTRTQPSFTQQFEELAKKRKPMAKKDLVPLIQIALEFDSIEGVGLSTSKTVHQLLAIIEEHSLKLQPEDLFQDEA